MLYTRLAKKNANVIEKVRSLFHLRVTQINCIGKQKSGSNPTHARARIPSYDLRSILAHILLRHIVTLLRLPYLKRQEVLCSRKPSWPAGTQGPGARAGFIYVKGQSQRIYTHRSIYIYIGGRSGGSCMYFLYICCSRGVIHETHQHSIVVSPV